MRFPAESRPVEKAAAPLLRRAEIDPGCDYVPPVGATQEALAAIMQSVLGVDRVGATDNFFELGGDSLQAVDLFVRIEQRFGVTLSPSTIINFPTIATLARLVAGKSEAARDGVLVVLQPDGPAPPLFLMHDASGDVLSYRLLVRHLGSARRIYGLVHPPQEWPPAATVTIPQWAAVYRDAILAVQPTGPYVLAGYSLGGVLAYEVMRSLQAQRQAIGLLVVIDSPIHDRSLLGRLQRMGRKVSHHARLMSHIADKGLRRPQGPEFAQSAENGTAMARLEAIYSAYRPPAYTGDLKLFRCTREHNSRYYPPDLGWAACVKGNIEICEIPTNHLGALADQGAEIIARQLRRWLNDMTAAHSL